MPINLSKGQKVDLTKGNPGLTKIMVGLGWDVNAFDSGSAFDLTRRPSCWAPAESAPRSVTSSSTATSSTAPARWSTWATT